MLLPKHSIASSFPFLQARMGRSNSIPTINKEKYNSSFLTEGNLKVINFLISHENNQEG
jgi:hypothetical protein